VNITNESKAELVRKLKTLDPMKKLLTCILLDGQDSRQLKDSQETVEHRFGDTQGGFSPENASPTKPNNSPQTGIIDLDRNDDLPIQSPLGTRSVQQSDLLEKEDHQNVLQPPVKRTKVDNNFREVVRNQEKRAQMKAFDCPECEAFYKATGHLPQLCQKAGKHRMHRPPTNTPPGFWDPWPFAQSDA